MPRLQNKISLITGAAQGIGLATALKFAKEGATVIVCDVKQAGVDDAVRQCQALGAQAVGYVMDVTQRAMVDAVVGKVKDQFGRIDVLVNNAGITQDARLQKMTLEQFDKVIDVNLRGVFHCAQAVADTMVAQGSGVILNASSVVGIYGNFGQTNYGAAKAGIYGMVRVMAIEGRKYNIRVMGLAPGAYTRMTSDLPGRQGREPDPLSLPENVAPGVLFMVSDLAADHSGKILGVSSRGVREIKMLETSGFTPGRPYTAEEVAANADKVFFPEREGRAVTLA